MHLLRTDAVIRAGSGFGCRLSRGRSGREGEALLAPRTRCLRRIATRENRVTALYSLSIDGTCYPSSGKRTRLHSHRWRPHRGSDSGPVSAVLQVRTQPGEGEK